MIVSRSPWVRFLDHLTLRHITCPSPSSAKSTATFRLEPKATWAHKPLGESRGSFL